MYLRIRPSTLSRKRFGGAAGLTGGDAHTGSQFVVVENSGIPWDMAPVRCLNVSGLRKEQWRAFKIWPKMNARLAA